MRTSVTRITVVCCLALSLAAPAVAGAQQSPFQALPPAQQPTATATTSTTSSSTVDNGGLKRWQELLMFGAGVVLLAGIGFAIIGDARKRAPVTEAEAAGRHKSGQGATKAHKKAKSRKQGKAARAARRHNR